MVVIPAPYMDGTEFESRPGGELSWLRFVPVSSQDLEANFREVNVNLTLCLITEAPRYDDAWGSGGILNLGTRWR
jgi:hypothetical protein